MVNTLRNCSRDKPPFGMKIFVAFALIIFSLLVVSVDCYSQFVDDSTLHSETLWGMKKKRMVLDYMDMTEAEKACFWPLYENYSNAIQFLEMQSLELIYESNHVSETLSLKDLEKYNTQLLENDMALAKIRKQFYKKFSKALSPTRAIQFLQFDETFRQMLRYEIIEGPSDDDVHASLRN
jgi:hypothetical protein